MTNPISSGSQRGSGGSILHRLDPRVKVITAFVLIIGIVVTPNYAWLAYPLLWTLVGSLAAVGQLSVWRLGRRAVLALPFTLAASTLLVTTPGQPLMSAAGLTVTDTGIGLFLGILLKSWLSMQVALMLTAVTSTPELLAALRGLGVSKTLVATISMMQRYLFTLKDEAESLLRARAARSGIESGMKSGGTLLWRAQVTGGMVGNLFLRSYERSERVYAAMLARGYSGEVRSFELPPLTWKALNPAIFVLVMVIGIQVIVSR